MAAPRPQVARRRATSRPAPARPTAATGKGCLFAGRCARQVGPLCDEVAPPWRTTDAGIRIRCHIDLADLSRRATERHVASGRLAATSARSSLVEAPHAARANEPSL